MLFLKNQCCFKHVIVCICICFAAVLTNSIKIFKDLLNILMSTYYFVKKTYCKINNVAPDPHISYVTIFVDYWAQGLDLFVT